jgi:hypothetical protein
VFEHTFEHLSEGVALVRQNARATVPMPDMAQDAAVSRSLELQLLLGTAIETLLRLQYQKDIAGGGLEILAELASRFDRAVDELSGGPRTLSQSAGAVGFVTAAQQAFGGMGTREHLAALSVELRSAARRELPGSDLGKLIDALDRLHGVLLSGRATPTDEVRGLRRLA